MATKETDAKPEQRKPRNVHQPTARKKHPDEESTARTTSSLVVPRTRVRNRR